jgi:hypothetical protein
MVRARGAGRRLLTVVRVFDLLINAEVIVDDVDVAERVFVDALGFPEPRPEWSRKTPGYGFTFLFARVHPSMKVSPTRIEAMAVAPLDPAIDPGQTIDFLPRLLAAQGDRPWKTHANELASADIRSVAARLDAHRCRFYTMPGDDQHPFARLWLGWTADDRGAYEPDVDGGLLLEICETDALFQGSKLWEPTPAPDLPPGSMVRVLRRSWIVADLAATLSALDANLDLRPDTAPEIDGERGCRRAVLRFAHPRSAELELLEPSGAGEIKDAFDAWGPGSWSIRIGVNDVAAKADDLEQRGTAFERRAHPRDGATLCVDTGPLDVPGRFEFARA